MKRFLFIPLLLVWGFSLKVIAQGDLLITPIRVVFESNKQKEALNLVNTGKDTATYSISFIQFDMKEDGSFVSIQKPDSGEMFADPYLRIFPRKITLAPGEPQVIMLQCMRKANMLPGEYRSHLYFRAEKNNLPLGLKNSAIDTAHLSVQLIPVYGISIPIIIRMGTTYVKCNLSDLRLDTQQGTSQYLRLTINRSGNISIYGDIKIEFFPEKGKPFEIGSVTGVGVYTNIDKRNIVVKLNNTSGTPLTKGKLKAQYVSNGETKRVVYAEEEMEIK
jgi:hypothetical protein